MGTDDDWRERPGEGEHPLVKLARLAVESYVKDHMVIKMSVGLTREMLGQAGVFVSIKKHGELRGCIGTSEPAQLTVAEEIIQNAICSATRDPRFVPVRPNELPNLSYSVDILTHPEPVTDLAVLDPHRYGVLVVNGGRRGLLLPDLEGIDQVEQQLEIARLKAGILPGEPAEVLRFEVRRYR